MLSPIALFKKILNSRLNKQFHNMYRSQFKKYLKSLGFDSNPAEGESEYIKKWSVFNSTVEPYSYRLFSLFIGHRPDIIPEDIAHRYIEDVLNPIRYRSYYSDKNLFDVTFHPGTMPRTILRRIGGSSLLDNNYRLYNGEISAAISCEVNRLILKPSVDSNSGNGVELFVKNEQSRYANSKSGKILSNEYLMKYGNNWILQEAIRQSPYISQFNPTSINTLRLALYRSVKDEQIHITGAIMRIGRAGEFVDNAHAGGMFIGINPNTGELSSHTMDQYGNKSNIWNNIDFSSSHFMVPNWDKVLDFAKYIGSCNHHCRLIALDIALDVNNNPILVEYNVDAFSFWLFMFTNQHPFGNFTDEIIEHCLEHQDNDIKMRIGHYEL